jgi:hypothetical protein
MRGFFGVLFFGLVALVAGAIGYNIGLTSTSGAAERIVYVGGGGWFGGFGFLFFLFFLFLIFSFAGRRRAWGGGHWNSGHWNSGYGRGPWGGPGSPTGMTGPDASTDPRRQWVADMHRSLHEADAKAGESTGSTPPTTPPTAG